MSLYLAEFVSDAGIADHTALFDRVAEQVAARAGAVVEFLVGAGGHRVFVVAEIEGAESLTRALAAGLGEAARVDVAPVPVRLVGAQPADLKAHAPAAGYLVEWDLPAELTMDEYLARKKANSPRYADVPETRFLRTYVREDMVKCLCLYDAPDEGFVRKAREAVSAPVDRLHALENRG
jgi:hypothetical protein